MHKLTQGIAIEAKKNCVKHDALKDSKTQRLAGG